MIDIHAHILPCVDDGSDSLEETLQLLRLSREQGVTELVATPHFYAHKDTPQQFLACRKEAAAQIVWEDWMPKIHLGAEVTYFPGMSRSRELELLQIGSSRLLLVEMPFSKWTASVVDEVCQIQNRQGLQPVLAHVDRYRSAGQFSACEAVLEEAGVLFQYNAAAFRPGWAGRWAIGQLRKGKVHFLGSDCHNLTTRPPRLEAATRVIEGKLGRDALQMLDTCAATCLHQFD